MQFRSVISALLFAWVLPIPVTNAQQITSDVLVSGVGLEDGASGFACDSKGQAYRMPIIGGRSDNSIMRISRDGSTLLFKFPAEENLQTYAPANPDMANPGLVILAVSTRLGKADSPDTFMYRFDTQGIVTRRPVSIHFRPSKMAVTSSGKAIVVGHSEYGSWLPTKYIGAVLDADDQVVHTFNIPMTATDAWTPISQMTISDDVAYVILNSGTAPNYALATIAESGHVDLKILPVPPDSEKRHHNEWYFGPGVAVEEYHFVGEKPRVTFRFDEYDLGSGKNIRTRTTLPAGFAVGCYLGDEITMFAHRREEKSAIHLVTVKLENEIVPESAPAAK